MRYTGMSPVVEAWSTCRTSSAQDWPPHRLLRAKDKTTVSVVIPARNEQATVGTIVTAIRTALVQPAPLTPRRYAPAPEGSTPSHNRRTTTFPPEG